MAKRHVYTYPTPDKEAFYRTRLIEPLNRAPHFDLLLCSGAAGIGKTTLIAQWVNAYSNCAWLNLTQDNALDYAQQLIDALALLADKTPTATSPRHRHHKKQQQQQIYQAIIDSCYQIHTPTILVIDNYHWLNETTGDEITRTLLENAPAHLTIVLISRQTPVLALGHLRLKKTVHTLNIHSLLFTQEECRQWLIPQGLSPSRCERWFQLTQGHPALLQLLRFAIQPPSWITEDDNTTLALTQCSLWHYCEEEFWQPLSTSQRDVAMALSMVEEVHSSVLTQLGQQLRKDNHWFEELQQLPVAPPLTENGIECWSLSAILQRFYQIKYHQLRPFALAQLHQIATQGWASLSPKRALAHAIKSECPQTLETLLTHHGTTLLAMIPNHQMAQAFALLPPIGLNSNLLLLMFWWRSQSESAHQLSHQLEQSLESLPPQQREMIAGDVQAIKADLAWRNKQIAPAERLAQMALFNSPQLHKRSQLLATLTLTRVYQYQGKLERSHALAQQGEKHCRQQQWHDLSIAFLLLQIDSQLSSAQMVNVDYLMTRTEQLISKTSGLPSATQENWYQIKHHHFATTGQWNRLADSLLTKKRSQPNNANLPSQIEHDYYCALLTFSLEQPESFTQCMAHLLSQTAELKRSLRLNVAISRLLIEYWRDQPVKLKLWLEGAEQETERNDAIAHAQWRNVARTYHYLGRSKEALTLLDQQRQRAQHNQLWLEVQRHLWLSASLYSELANVDAALDTLHHLISLNLDTVSYGEFYLEKYSRICAIADVLSQAKSPHLSTSALAHYVTTARQHKENNSTPNQIDKDKSSPVNRTMHKIESPYYQMQQSLQRIALRHSAAHSISCPPPFVPLFHHDTVAKLLHQGVLTRYGIHEALTDREWQVFDLIRSKWKNDQIARHFNVAPSTVKTHIRHLYQKLQLSGRPAAVNLAKQLACDIDRITNFRSTSDKTEN